ncbi:MAG: carboxylate-amine ligase, partial [Chloroflexota bacterium]
EVVAVVALVQALAAKLIQLRQRNISWRIYRRNLIEENKWRAVREGIGGELIDFGKSEAIPTRLLMNELIELVSDVAEELGSTEEIEYIKTMLHKGTSADRQVSLYTETNSLEAVVDQLATETVEGCM